MQTYDKLCTHTDTSRIKAQKASHISNTLHCCSNNSIFFQCSISSRKHSSSWRALFLSLRSRCSLCMLISRSHSSRSFLRRCFLSFFPFCRLENFILVWTVNKLGTVQGFSNLLNWSQSVGLKWTWWHNNG